MINQNILDIIIEIKHTDNASLNIYSLTSKSIRGGPVSESKEAFNRLWRLHEATKAAS